MARRSFVQPWDHQNSKLHPSHPYFAPTDRDTEKDESLVFAVLLRDYTKNKDLRRGTQLHNEILKKGLLRKCSDALIIMYAKCGALIKAEELFGMHKPRDVRTWTALMGGYIQAGQAQMALSCFDMMKQEGLSPNAVTYSCILKACASLRTTDKGEKIHDEIAKQGLLKSDVILGNALLAMYAKCGSLAKAQQVLEKLPLRNVISWTALIEGYTEHGQAEQALICFERMQCEGLSPDAVTFICILKACGSMRAADKGEKIHDDIVKQGLLKDDIVLGTALVDMYAKCGALTKAQRVLEELPVRNVISWNALIAGYAEHDRGEEALECYERMQSEGISPDAVTFLCILKACVRAGTADKGGKIHDEIMKQELLLQNIVVGNALVNMYAKCGSPEKALQVLEDLPVRNVSSWNALIGGSVENGEGEQALNYFEWMKREGLCPDAVTYSCILKACGSIGAIDKGEKTHDEIVKQGLLGNNIVLGNAVVDMYATCGALRKAQQVLEELPGRDAISWHALIAGYAAHGEAEQAITCFKQMQCEGFSPETATFVSILKACAGVGAVDKGENVRDEIAKQGLLGKDVALGTALVDMYVKCGALIKAQHTLQELPSRNVVTWTALIAGYAEHGEKEQVLKCFDQMREDDLFPNAATFSCVLSTCNRLGLVEDAQVYLTSMSRKFCIKPGLEHYTSMVDLFGRVGNLDKVVEVVERILPFSDSVVWLSILGACRRWEGAEVGRWAFEHAAKVDKRDSRDSCSCG